MVVPVSALQYGYLGEPLALAGLPEVAGRLAERALGIVGHAQQLGLARGIPLLFGQFAGQYGMTFGPEHYGVANDDHGLQEGALFAVVLGAHGIRAASFSWASFLMPLKPRFRILA